MQRHDRLLPLPPLPPAPAAPLGLRLHPCRPDAGHAHAEDVLDRLAHLRLVRPLVHAERVLVGPEQGVALLRDDGPDDHLARVHFATAFSLRRPSAASDTMSRPLPTMSAIPTSSTCRTATSARLRNDLAQVSSPSPSTTSTLPSPSKPAIVAAAALVEGVSKLDGSSAAIVPRSAWSDRAARSARRRALRFTLTV